MSDKPANQESERAQNIHDRSSMQRNGNDVERSSDNPLEGSDAQRQQHIPGNQTDQPYTEGRTMEQANDPDKLSDL